MQSIRDTDVLLIINPAAGGRRGRRTLGALLRSVRAALPRLDIVFTLRPGDGRTLAARAVSEGFQTVLCAGGDGTINEVINGLAGSLVPLGILPMGTANVLAREIGTPMNPEHSINALLRGEIRRVHLGKAGDRRFILMAGVGFDAEVVARASGEIKRRVGGLAYGIAGVQTLFRYSYPPLSIRCDGEMREATSVVFCKARRYAGDFIVAPGASLNEPLLHARFFSGTGPVIYARHALRLLSGLGPDGKQSTGCVCREAEVSAPVPVPIHIDGELIGVTPMTFGIDEDALALIAPK